MSLMFLPFPQDAACRHSLKDVHLLNDLLLSNLKILRCDRHGSKRDRFGDGGQRSTEEGLELDELALNGLLYQTDLDARISLISGCDGSFLCCSASGRV